VKLKYKLFLSYLTLIAIISVVLFIQSSQISFVDHTVRTRIGKNTQAVIDLSMQQQILETIYDRYLLFHSSSAGRDRYKQGLLNAIDEYKANWNRYTDYAVTDSFMILKPLRAFLDRYNPPVSPDRAAIEAQVSGLWYQTEREIKKEILDSESRLAAVKSAIFRLRPEMNKLSRIIGEEARSSSAAMRGAVESLQWITWTVFGVIFILSIGIALFVTRRLTRPIEALQAAVEQVAIQDFDVYIEDKPGDEIGDLADAFEQMAYRLKKNEIFKSEMLSQFTHEMKSPLGAIKQAATLLEPADHTVSEKDRKRLLSIIKGNNETLFRLINNILSSARLEKSETTLELKMDNLTRILTNVLMMLSPLIREKNIRVNIDYASEKVECEIDGEKMAEVFHNLINNAIKFSPQGSQFFVSVIEKYPTVIIKFRDQGIGIPAKEIPYIFEKLYRASNSKHISVKGTGLGLYIVSHIIRLHGGKIQVKSREGEGTEFTITLPRTRQIAKEGGWL
jgi:signal transduction histidine kinase